MIPGTITPLIVGKFKEVSDLVDIQSFSVTVGSQRDDNFGIKAPRNSDFARNYYSKVDCVLKIVNASQNCATFKYLRDSLVSSENPVLRVVTMTEDLTLIKCFDTWVESLTFQKNGMFKDAIINCGNPILSVESVTPVFSIEDSLPGYDYLMDVSVSKLSEDDLEHIISFLEEHNPHLTHSYSSNSLQIQGVVSLTDKFNTQRLVDELYLMTKGRSPFKLQLTGLDDSYSHNTVYPEGRLELRSSLRSLILEKLKDKVLEL